MSTSPILSTRRLNRALLERQGLLRRAHGSVTDTVAWLVGMQGQTPQSPYIGLWSRLDGFRPEELSELLLGRRLVRIAVMRATIHLVTAEDALLLRPLTQRLSARTFASTVWGKELRDADTSPILTAARDLLNAEPMLTGRVGALLRERWPIYSAAALGAAARYLLPLVQVPPRGLWRRSGPAAHTTLEAWVGRPLEAAPSIDGVVLRYLAAYGPATVADVRTWSGIVGLREVLERLRPRLRTFRDERGRELFDVPDGALPNADSPASVRFLPDYDNALLGHEDRGRVLSKETRRRLGAVERGSFGSVLVDGFGAATWRVRRDRERMTLRVEPLRDLSGAEASEVMAEAEALLEFLAPPGPPREVVLERPG